jgi:hypothetical protein
MKTIAKILGVSAAMLACAPILSAQNRSAYFVENYAYKYQMNPALTANSNPDEQGFTFSFPALGNLNVGLMGNAGVDNFIYKINGKTTTFLHPDVTTDEFLNGLHDTNRIGASIREGIMDFGFKAFNGYNHVSLNAVANVNARVPKALLSFLKEDIANNSYQLGDVTGNINAYAELALNHSHQINSQLRVGGTVKFLFGIGNLDIDLTEANLTLGENGWTAATNGEIHTSMKNFNYKHKVNSRTNHTYVNGVDLDGAGLNGFGLAVDLGAVYTLNPDWEFSFALTDLGFISWKNDYLASTEGEQSFDLNDYSFDPNDFDESWDVIGDNFSKIYELNDEGDQGSRSKSLYTTMNIGAKYTLPTYRKLNFGLLNTTRMAGKYSWTDFRLSANVAPVKCFSCGINLGVGTFGSSFGWIANVYTKGFNAYVGMDHTLGKLAKQGVPINSNAQFSFGINFPL